MAGGGPPSAVGFSVQVAPDGSKTRPPVCSNTPSMVWLRQHLKKPSGTVMVSNTHSVRSRNVPGALCAQGVGVASSTDVYVQESTVVQDQRPMKGLPASASAPESAIPPPPTSVLGEPQACGSTPPPQVSGNEHATQRCPPAPQSSSKTPTWQVPWASQHPFGHEVESQPTLGEISTDPAQIVTLSGDE